MDNKIIPTVLKENIQIVEHYGANKQIPIWIEEMAELTKVLCKWARVYEKNEGDIPEDIYMAMYEEIADVTICLDQLKYVMHLYEDDLMNLYSKKVQRQLDRIKHEK